MFELTGKVVVVTGSEGLLGNALVMALKKQGAQVVGLDIKSEQNKADYLYLKTDTTDENAVTAAILQIQTQLGPINGWVNNAYPRTSDWGLRVEQLPFESWKKNVDMQLNGYYICCKVVLEHMKKNGMGSLVNMSSIYGHVAPDFSVYEGTEMTMPVAYSAIKGAVTNLTRYLASYYGPSGIRVNTISPGGVFANQPESFVKNYSKKVPLKRMAESRDIAAAVCFLLADETSYITGHNLVVDGGWSIV